MRRAESFPAIGSEPALGGEAVSRTFSIKGITSTAGLTEADGKALAAEGEKLLKQLNRLGAEQFFEACRGDPGSLDLLNGVLKSSKIATKFESLLPAFGRDNTLETQRKRMLAAIVALSWAIHTHAGSRPGEKAVIRGSYAILDENKNLLNFLKHYATFCHCGESHSVEKHAALPSWVRSSLAYQRGSSHYEDKDRPELQFGMDMEFEPGQGSLQILPGNSSHLLAGLIIDPTGSTKTMIKFEVAGLGTASSTLFHGSDYAKKVVLKGGKTVDEARENTYPLKGAFRKLASLLKKHHSGAYEAVKKEFREQREVSASEKKQPFSKLYQTGSIATVMKIMGQPLQEGARGEIPSPGLENALNDRDIQRELTSLQESFQSLPKSNQLYSTRTTGRECIVDFKALCSSLHLGGTDTQEPATEASGSAGNTDGPPCGPSAEGRTDPGEFA